jgi:tRNA G10  N-methylase Trm11
MCNKRDILDRFYTIPEVAENCTNIFKEVINITQKDLIIEPSVGSGNFLSGISNITNNYIGYDIDNSLFNQDYIKPEYKNKVFLQDFLTLDYSKLQNEYNNIYILGNPPFGKQSSVAIKFIKYICKFCTAFGLILPKSFKKQSLQDKIPLDFSNILTIDIPENSFSYIDTSTNVSTIFCIYIKTKVREKHKKLKPINYEFVNRYKEYDISVRRVGINAGEIDINKNYINKSIQSHYFIKFTNKEIDKDEIVKQLKNIDLYNILI